MMDRLDYIIEEISLKAGTHDANYQFKDAAAKMIDDLRTSIEEFTSFCRQFTGQNEESIMEIKFNGEHSDLYAHQFKDLMEKLENSIK